MDITDHLLPQVRVFWVEGTAAPVDAQVPKPCTGQRGLLTQVTHSFCKPPGRHCSLQGHLPGPGDLEALSTPFLPLESLSPVGSR